jgi:hypothetical protein
MPFSHPFFALYASFDIMDIYITNKVKSSKKKYSPERLAGSNYCPQGSKKRGSLASCFSHLSFPFHALYFRITSDSR